MQFVTNNKGFVIGVLFAIVTLSLPTPEGLSAEAHKTAALFLLMGVWWATEAVPVAVTALVPLALFPILGIVDIQVLLTHMPIKPFIILWWFSSCNSNSKMGFT